MFGDIYAELLVDLLGGLDLRVSVKKAGMAIGVDVEAMGKGQDPMTACYIDSSFPAMLFFLLTSIMMTLERLCWLGLMLGERM